MKRKLLLCLLFAVLCKMEGLLAQNAYQKPIAITPRDGWTITKEALSFRFAPNANDAAFKAHLDSVTFGTNSEFGNWKPKKFNSQKATSYHIQVSKKNNVWNGADRVLNETIKIWAMQHGTAQYIPNAILPAGTYYWRVRCKVGNKISSWTTPKQVILVNKSSNTPMRYAISNTNPLFVFCDAQPDKIYGNDTDYFNNLHIEGFSKNDFSASKRKHVAIIVNDRTKGPERFKVNTYQIDDYENKYDQLKNWGYKSMVFHQYSLAEQDWFYRKYDNCIGTFTGETEDLVDFRKDNDGLNKMTNLFYHRSLILADKHGGYFMNATHFTGKSLIGKHDEPHFTNDAEHNVLQTYGEHLIWGRKTTNIYANHISNAYWNGLWLDGLLGNMSLWMENYFVRRGNDVNPTLFPLVNNNVPDTHMPMALEAKEMLYAAASGATVFISRDNDNSTNANRTRSARRDHIYKLFEKLIDESLIPSRAEMRAKHKTAIKFEQENKHVSRNTNDYKTIYQDYEDLFVHTYKINQYSMEKTATDLIPDDGGRYHMIPIVTRKSVSNSWNTTRIDIDNLNVTGRFNSTRYPAIHTGTAWVAKTGDNFFAINSIEARTGIADQTYDINLGNGYIDRIKGNLNISTYVMGKMKNGGNKLTIMANSHRFDQHLINGGDVTVDWPKENTVINVFSDTEPNVSVSPANALVSANWNATNKRMRVTVKHNGGWDIVTIDVTKPGTSRLAASDQAQARMITLYPNPATDQVIISGEFKSWEIVDAFGRVHLAGSEKKVNISVLTQGIYFVKLDHAITKKLIVN